MPTALDIDILRSVNSFYGYITFQFYGSPLKQEEEDGEIEYFAKCQKLLKQLSKVQAIVRITKQHLRDILKGFN